MKPWPTIATLIEFAIRSILLFVNEIKVFDYWNFLHRLMQDTILHSLSCLNDECHQRNNS